MYNIYVQKWACPPGFILVYLFSIVAYLKFPDAFVTADGHKLCHTLWQCLVLRWVAMFLWSQSAGLCLKELEHSPGVGSINQKKKRNFHTKMPICGILGWGGLACDC